MDAKEFIRQRNRMCKKYNSAGNVGCKNCPAWEYSCVGVDEMEDDGFKLVDIVEKWAKYNPPKTRQSELLKLFPHTRLTKNGVIDICLMNFNNSRMCSYNYDCDSCMERYWLEEIE